MENQNEQKRIDEGNSYSKSSLVLGIIGLFFFPIICSTLAIIFGFMAKNRKTSLPGQATAGVILGIVSLSLYVVAISCLVCIGLSDYSGALYY